MAEDSEKNPSPCLFLKKETVFLRLFVQPGAKKTAIDQLHDQELRITVHAVQVRGAANAALIKFLSQLLEIPRKHITICKGATSRHKLLAIDFSPISTILDRLAKKIPLLFS